MHYIPTKNKKYLNVLNLEAYLIILIFESQFNIQHYSLALLKSAFTLFTGYYVNRETIPDLVFPGISVFLDS